MQVSIKADASCELSLMVGLSKLYVNSIEMQ